ncbi:S28 family serine protease [Saccharopolyspora taberi]|uniref:S28 family serine protease n=1 Tax=Saccharopolyspora taberi TaxID=60895 RepID=A0ABN3V5D7_9PSEU
MKWRGAVTAAVACGLLFGGLPAAAAPPDEVREQLERVPGLTIVGERPTEPGFRLFDLTFAQPVDHHDPASGVFQQRLTLLHRDFARPTVAYTSGYNLPQKANRSEPTQLLDGNQVSIEHRFFTPSRPEPADWGDLDIWQSATDEHRIIDSFKAAYGQKWITTGGSKGGMTAVYHRRFYPEDVDGTVAYVAPNDVDNDEDGYDEFLADVGPDPACRDALTTAQREALLRREEMLKRFGDYAAQNGFTFDRTVGDIDRALELVVSDTPFAFWQYGGVADCAGIPAKNASTDDIYAFFDKTVQFSSYTDQGLDKYVPYYYQAGTQLGWPHVTNPKLADLLHHDDLAEPRGLVPRDIPMSFEKGVMAEVDDWVRSEGSELMFVNGEYDPWNTEPFELGGGTEDSFSYVVPAGNHGADIEGLPADQKSEATAALRRWGGVEASIKVSNTELDERPLERHPF